MIGAIAKKVTIIQKSEEIISYLLDPLKIETVYIPKGITKIGMNAFRNTSIATVYYEGTESQWRDIIIEEGNDELLNARIVYNYIE